MAGAVSGLHVFTGDTGPEQLSLLDGNYAALTTALNTLANFGNYYADAGAVNSLVVTVPAPQVFAYTDGIELQVKVAVTNTGACIINVNTLGAKAIVNSDGSALVAGQLQAGAFADLQYNGGTGQFFLGSVSGSISAPAFNVTGAAVPANGLNLPGANTLGFAAGSTQWGTLNAGNWVFNAPTAGSTLMLTQVAGSTQALQISAPTGQS